MSALVFPDNDAEAWINALSHTESRLAKELLAAKLTEYEVAEFWLSRSGSDTTLGFSSGASAKRYLQSVQIEFQKLICGGTEYDHIRKDFSNLWQKGRGAVLAYVALAISSFTSIAVAVVTPVIALLFAAVCKVGVNAWCSMASA